MRGNPRISFAETAIYRLSAFLAAENKGIQRPDKVFSFRKTLRLKNSLLISSASGQECFLDRQSPDSRLISFPRLSLVSSLDIGNF